MFQNHIILGQIFQTVLNNKSKENETFVDSHKQKGGNPKDQTDQNP